MLAKLKARLGGELGRALLRTFTARGVAVGGTVLEERAWLWAGVGIGGVVSSCLRNGGVLASGTQRQHSGGASEIEKCKPR